MSKQTIQNARQVQGQSRLSSMISKRDVRDQAESKTEKKWRSKAGSTGTMKKAQ